MDNRYFREHRLNYPDYGSWYRIFFKPGQELIDATGVKHDFVYGTPIGDTQPPQNKDPENEIPPTREFYILCDEQSKNECKTGKMVPIPNIPNITLTIDNTDQILPYRGEIPASCRPKTLPEAALPVKVSAFTPNIRRHSEGGQRYGKTKRKKIGKKR